MSVIVSLNSPPCLFLFSLFPLIASHSSTLPRFSIKALCISSFNSRCPWFFILTASIYLVFPSLSHPFSFSAVDQSGSAGSGQPLINAIRTDSALIGGTVFFLKHTSLYREPSSPCFAAFCCWTFLELRETQYFSDKGFLAKVIWWAKYFIWTKLHRPASLQNDSKWRLIPKCSYKVVARQKWEILVFQCTKGSWTNQTSAETFTLLSSKVLKPK